MRGGTGCYGWGWEWGWLGEGVYTAFLWIILSRDYPSRLQLCKNQTPGYDPVWRWTRDRKRALIRMCLPSIASGEVSKLLTSLWLSCAIWWHRSGSTLAQLMVRCLIPPHPYPNQYWFISAIISVKQVVSVPSMPISYLFSTTIALCYH